MADVSSRLPSGSLLNNGADKNTILSLLPPPPPATLFMHEFIAGWIGGAAGVFVGHPLDTLKVRMQANKSAHKANMLSMTRHMLFHEGPKTFFRGMTFPIASAGPISALWFAGYELSLRQLEHQQHSTSKLKHYTNIYIAACVGYIWCLPFTNIVDVVKVNMQMRTTPPERPFIYAFVKLKQIYQQYGVIHGLFRGGVLQFWRDVPTAGVYFLTYEMTLDYLVKCEAYWTLANDSHEKIKTVSSPREQAQQKQPNNHSTFNILVAGGLAGVLCWLASLPQDVVKTRYQVMPLQERGESGRGRAQKLEPAPGLWKACSRIVAEEGWRSLFKGAVPMSVRAFPVNAVTFFGYEMTMKLFRPKTTTTTAP